MPRQAPRLRSRNGISPGRRTRSADGLGFREMLEIQGRHAQRSMAPIPHKLAAWQTDGRRSSKRSHKLTDNGVGRVSAEPPPTEVCSTSIELES
jgi:hypothetical protein